MSDAINKTKSIERKDIPVELLEVNELNPNEMSPAQFNLLYDNIERMGIVDAIMVRPVEGGKYRVVGGAHRLEVAKLLDFTEVPCTIVDHEDFTEDEEKFQLVRMNIVRGQMTPEKFLKLYESLTEEYTQEALQDAFGFIEESEFRKMIKDVSKGIPNSMKEEFKEAIKEVRTIDDLARVLNELFMKNGDALDYGYMILDAGKNKNVWVRTTDKTYKSIMDVAKICRKEKRTLDAIIGGLLVKLAKGELDTHLEQIIESTEEIVVPDSAPYPTEDYSGILE